MKANSCNFAIRVKEMIIREPGKRPRLQEPYHRCDLRGIKCVKKYPYKCKDYRE